jgi:hypothetical protein
VSAIHSGRNLYSGVSAPGLPVPPPSDRGGGLSPAGKCVSEQLLLQVVPPGNPSRFLSGTLGGLFALPLLERHSESDRAFIVQVQEAAMDSEADSSGVQPALRSDRLLTITNWFL